MRSTVSPIRFRRCTSRAKRSVIGIRVLSLPARALQGERMGQRRDRYVIARDFFGSPRALFYVAQDREQDLQLDLAYCDDRVWLRVFDFVQAVNALREWVVAARPDLAPEVRQLERAPAIRACRDIANAGKHIVIDKYEPSVRELTHSLVPSMTHSLGSARQWWLKVVLGDGSRVRMDDVAAEAISLWEAFFAKHDIDP